MSKSLDLGTLHAKIGLDSKGYDRGIDEAQKKMAGFRRDATGELRDLNAKFVKAGVDGGEAYGDGFRDKANNEVEGFKRDANGRLRNARGHFVKEGEAAGKGYGDGFRRKADEEVDGWHRDANGRMRDAKGRFRKHGEESGEEYSDGFRRKARKPLLLWLDEVESRLGQLTARFGNFFGHIARGARRIALPAVLGLIATAAAAAASSLGPLITLVGALVSALGGAAAAAPAFIAALAAAVGTLKLGYSGMGDALAGDEEAMERLAPAAREMVKAVQALGPAWDRVTSSVQQALWDGLADQFTQVAARVLPRLQSGLTGVAHGFNTLGSEALAAFGSAEAIGGLDAVLRGTQKGIEAFAGGIEGWIKAIGNLLQMTSPLLADAGAAAARLGDRFLAWTVRAEQSGRVTVWLDTMKTTLVTLGSLLGNLGSILASVFGAANAAGGGLLGTLDEVTGRFADWLKTAEGASALNDFFAALATVGAAATPVILALADVFATKLAPKIGDIALNIGPQLETVIGRIGDVIGNLDIAQLAAAFGDFLSVMSTLLVPAGKVLEFLIAISPVLLPLLAGVSVGIGVFKAFQAAMVLVTIAQWAWNAALFASPITWIILAIVALIAIVVLLAMHWDEVTAVIAVAWEWLKTKATEVFTAIGEFFINLWNSISEFFIGIWDGIKAVFALAWQWMIAQATKQVAAVLNVISWFKELPGRVGEWFQGVYTSAKNKLTAMVDWVKGIPGRIKTALGDLGSLLLNAGKDLINGLIGGIKDKFGDVKNTLGDLTSSMTDWKGPAAVDRVLFKPAAQMIMGGFADWLEAGVPRVRDVLQDLTSDMGLQVDAAASPSAAAPTFVVDIGDIELSQNVQVELDGQVLDARILGTVNQQQRQTRRRVLAGAGGNL